MELEQMQELWNAQPAGHKTTQQMEQMLKERTHPVIKKIRLQLLIEILGWSLLLLVYYSMFDGEKRSLMVNLLFVAGLLQAIVSNLSAYFAVRNLVQGGNIVSSLAGYIRNLRNYRWVAIASRVFLMAGFLLFFTYGLEMNTRRSTTISVIALVFALQLYVLYRQWSKKISRIEQIYEATDAT